MGAAHPPLAGAAPAVHGAPTPPVARCTRRLDAHRRGEHLCGMFADAAVPALHAHHCRNAGRRTLVNSSRGARACSRRGADLRARSQGQPRDSSSRCPSARVRRAPRWLTASMPLTAIGELSSLSTRSGRVATSESSEHKGCLRPARIPRRSQTASLRLNKAQRHVLRVVLASAARPAAERAPLTGQNDR